MCKKFWADIVASCVCGEPEVYCSKRLAGIGSINGGWLLVVLVGYVDSFGSVVSPMAGMLINKAWWSLWMVGMVLHVLCRSGNGCREGRCLII